MANAYRAYRTIERRKCRQIMVGSVPVGGDAPISVQTMTNTLTTDVGGTMAQITAAAEAGADIVRVSCPDEDSTRALKEICAESPARLLPTSISITAEPSRRRRRERHACGSTPAISATRKECAR